MHKGSDITFSSRHLQSSHIKNAVKQGKIYFSGDTTKARICPWNIQYIQSTVTCWESQSSSAGTAVHLGSGSQPNASHEYWCQLQPDSPVSFLNATYQHFQQGLPREGSLIDSAEDSSTASSLHSFHLWDWISFIVCAIWREKVLCHPCVYPPWSDP